MNQMVSKTFLECFEDEHPHYGTDNEEEMERKKCTPSSTATKDQRPPRVLVDLNVGYWLTIANDMLKSKVLRADHSLNTHRIYPQISHGIATEQDVVNLATMYLLPPVMAAIDVLYPEKMTQYSEYTSKGLRMDHLIKTKEQGQNNAVMLIEFKSCWYIHENEFKASMLDKAYLGAQLDLLQRREIWNTLTTKNNNACLFVKQATAYSGETNCRYVALCDWEHLILIRFKANNDLESADVTIVPRPRFRRRYWDFWLRRVRL
jgi:hypothetical protein